jgi:RecA-family ATPase
MQLAITFALGKPLFRDLRPLRPFKFLIIQAENDKGDLAEPFQDITSEMQSKGFMESGDMEKLKQNLIFYGQASARTDCRRHGPGQTAGG